MSARRNISLIIAALSVLLCSACAEIEKPGNEGWTELGGDRPVLFNSSLATTATKSATLPDDTSFGVFAFYQPGNENSSGTWNGSQTPNFMFNQPVLFRLSNSYTYSPIKYWPNNSYNTITFWAYCPYNPTDDNIQFIESGTTDTQYTVSSTGYPDIKYTINTSTTDLLAATPVTDQSKPASDAPVSFEFHHALSRISFAVKKQANEPGDSNNYAITLTSISLRSINKTGIHSTGHWISYSNQGNFTVFNNSQLLTTDAMNVASVMMIPQNHANTSSKIHIDYTISLNSGTPQAFSSECYLKDLLDGNDNPISSWAESNQYTYTISIKPGMPISFTVSWDNWGDVYNWSLAI